MLEPEIAAFVARADAIYPDNTPSLPTVEQRAIYERLIEEGHRLNAR